MPWQNNGGNGGGKSPWGQGPRPTGGGGGGGAQPPNLDDILRRGGDRLKGGLPGGLGGGRGVALVIVAIVAIWALLGFYRVQPGEQGIPLVFGDYNEETGPRSEGLHWNWPAPIGAVYTPNLAFVNEETVGFTVRRSQESDVSSESLMLTGDENIIDIDFSVFWRIQDAQNFLFNIQFPEQTVKAVAESAMREVIGKTTLQNALTEGRDEIEQETKALMQAVLEDYQAGIIVTEVKLKQVDPPNKVIDDFRDVQAAEADRERFINEARRYRNDIVPKARGEAAKLVEQALAYKAEVVNRAEGEASRFSAVYTEYASAKDVTRKRIYLETMEEILRDVNKLVVDQGAGSGVVPYLPLPELQKRGAAQ